MNESAGDQKKMMSMMAAWRFGRWDWPLLVTLFLNKVRWILSMWEDERRWL